MFYGGECVAVKNELRAAMTEAEFRKAVKNLGGAFFFFGDEDYLKQNAIAVAKKTLFSDEGAAAFDMISIDRTAFSPDSLAAALAPPPMLSERKLIVLSLTLSDLRAAEQNELFDLLETVGTGNEETNLLIINMSADGFDAGTAKRPSAIYKKLAAVATPVRFDRINPARLASWVARHYTSRGVSASDRVCEATVRHCGTDMFRLSSEVDKISYFVLAHGKNEVTAEDIAAAASSSEEFDSFAFANAITARQYETALRVLAVMKAEKVEPVRIMADLIRVICDMQAVFVCRKAGMAQNEIASVTGINPYVLGRYLTAIEGMTAERLSTALAACREADAALKGYAKDYIPIERLVCAL
jgi:DNA polymerase-3 subunit delta